MNIFDTDLGVRGAPQFVIDRAAVERNFAKLRDAARGVPLRIATKSIRVRAVIEWALQQDGVAGVLAYSPAEALWLTRHGAHDVLVAYPSVDVDTVRAILRDDRARQEITLMVDLPEHVRLLAQVAGEVGSGELRVAIDVDSSLRLGPLALGTHRSSVHTPEEAGRLAEFIAATPGVTLVGAMFYEAQVAGVQDLTPVHRLIKKRSMLDLNVRRRAAVNRIREHADLEFVNGGGTGSVHLTCRDDSVTDIAVGSGLFTSCLFDRYRDLHTEPAAWFVAPVVRKPAPELAVTFSGGYVASGVPGVSRLPIPVYPQGLRYFREEGPGEVQTPLRGRGAAGLRIGDPVWFRHAKAGEVCERFDTAHVIDGGGTITTVPTYRGEGKNFG